jgi:hypothetical protein
MGLVGKKGGMDSKSSFLASFDEIYLKNTYLCADTC